MLASLLKSLIMPLVTEKAIRALVIFAAEIAVESTKTPHDDAFLEKIKELYEGE